MSVKELDRASVLEQVRAKQISKTKAGELLGMTRQHVDRLYKRFCLYGSEGLISKKRGMPSNNRISDAVRAEIAATIKANYSDFKPTFAHEKLTEVHHFKVSDETVRKIMIEHGLWKGKQKKNLWVHQMRVRRPSFGELIQIDGSPHDWFEGRRGKCCLLVFIDDATSKLVGLRFVETECLSGYFALMREYLLREGRPFALYSDRLSVFHVQIKEAESGTGETQFGRAMRELDIEIIPANSPQAKGRVEKANGTLQDRLVKEMRLLNISDIETANAYLPTFMAKYNRRFAVAPASPVNAHRPLLHTTEALDLILSLKDQRKLSKNLELSYKNVIYQVQTKTPGYAMRGAGVTVCESQGKVTLLYKGRTLEYKTFDKKNRPTEAVSSKDLNQYLDKRIYNKPPKPKPSHCWRGAPVIAKPIPLQNSHLSTVLPKQSDSSLSTASESHG